eukprot:1191538-Prorocentrum_minimum.AAC.2
MKVCGGVAEGLRMGCVGGAGGCSHPKMSSAVMPVAAQRQPSTMFSSLPGSSERLSSRKVV